jgi:rsbT co-antagonist protein RsbR
VNGTSQSKLPELLNSHQADILADWMGLQLAELSTGRRGVDERQLREESREFLTAFRSAVERGSAQPVTGPEWADVRSLLQRFTDLRVNQGFTPSEVATFVFSIKQPLFAVIRTTFGDDPVQLAELTWQVTTLVDRLGLHITEIYQKGRNEVIQRQQEEMLELSTPVVQLWHSILALPLIGTLDSARTQVVMQNLLEAIVRDSAEIAIIDITGVPTVDTLVAQHLLKTVAAARLMGADCIISGIRPQIAQTIIHLGVDLANVVTKATLADAFATALRRTGMTIVSTARKSGTEGV